LKTTEPGGWQRTSPFAVIFFFGKLLKAITKNAWQSLVPLVALIYASEGDLVTKIAFGVTAFFVISISFSVLNYWFFRFQLNDDAILIRHGVIRKKQLDINFDRIQGINTQQNVVFRFFKLVTVTFDTAGSKGSEGSLPAVPREFAASLRSRIGDRREPVDVETTESGSSVLLRLGWPDMFRIGLADRRALVALAALASLMGGIDDDAWENGASIVGQSITGMFQTSVTDAVLTVAAITVGLIVVLALLSVGAAFLRYHNFELSLVGNTLRSRAGLLTRQEVSMHLGKIQTLRLEQGLVMRWLNRYRLSARQARSSQKQGQQKNFMIPVVTAGTANHLRETLLGPQGEKLVQIPTSEQFVAISPYSMRSRILFLGLLPALTLALLFGLLLGWMSLVFLLWLPVTILFSFREWRHAGYILSAEGLVRRSGLIGYRSVALFYRKVQRISVTQSRYQRQKNLASLRVYMASGSVRIPFIDHTTAKQLRDYILYKVESSRQAWH
jgi:putative membrane protein